MNAFALHLFAMCASIAVVHWPELPKDKFIAGRAATIEDVKEGRAVFVIETHGVRTGKPLAVTIPQYAMYVEAETGREIPVVLIQAEESSGIQTVGYVEVGTSALGVCLLKELRLLGTEKPQS